MTSYTGWDISTSIIGVSMVNEEGRLIWKEHIDLRKIDELNDKTFALRKFIKGREWMGSKHFVEDRLGGFTRGMTSQQTLMRLASYNALASFVIEDELKTRPTHIHPSTVKAALKKIGLEIPKGSKEKKEITLLWAMSREPSWKIDLNRNEKPQPWNFDEADSYAMAIAGWLRNPSST